MLRNTIFKKITAGILFFTIIVQGTAFLLLPEKAEAQANASGVASLGPIVGAGVGCAIGLLGGSKKLQDLLDKSKVDAVPTGDAKTQKEVTEQKVKESCLDAIAYAAAKVALKKLTLTTIQWINTGFKGDPLFIVNYPSFFKSIADDEINSITGVLMGDAKLYPFGKDLARSIILSTQATFAANAQYSLDKVLSHANAVHFQADFSAGGWDGWLAATQILANNQIGAHIQAADEVTYRLQGTAQANAQDIRDKLLQARGFLDLQKCVELNNGTVPGDKYNYDDDGAHSGETGPSMQNGSYYTAGNGVDGKKCKRYETITPGEAIAGQMNISLGSSVRQAELADELNESLGAVFDALTSQLLNKGLSSLADSTSSSGVGIYGGYGSNSAGNTLTGGSGVTDPDQWYNANPTFDIWTDLQPVIDLQIIYKYLLWDRPFSKLQTDLGPQSLYKDMVREAPFVDNSGNPKKGGQNYVIRQQLLPGIYEFDFCVPGPNPLWENDANQKWNEFIANIPTAPDQVGKVQQFMSSHYSFTYNVLNTIFGETDKEKMESILTGIFDSFGIHIEKAGNISNADQATAVAYRVYEEYKDKIHDKYSIFGPDMQYMLVASELPAVYRQIPAYDQAAEDNDSEVEYRESIINKLKFIQNKIALIPKTPMDQLGTLTAAQQKDIQVYLRTIGRLAPDLADESIIEKLSDDFYVMEDLRDYVTNPNDGLVTRCKDELKDPHLAPVKGLRAKYPTELLSQAKQESYNGALGGFFVPSVQQNLGGSYLPAIYFGDFAGNQSLATGQTTDLSAYFAVTAQDQIFGRPCVAPYNLCIFDPKMGEKAHKRPGIWNITPAVDIAYLTDLVSLSEWSNFSGFEAFLDIY